MAYIGICSNNGKRVEEEDAFDFALEQIKSDEKEKQEFVEWFYSGNWIKQNDKED
jgi:hypothetical protein